MEVVLLDINLQHKTTTNPTKRDFKSIEKDFSSTLKAIETRKQNNDVNPNNIEKEIKSHTENTSDNIKVDEVEGNQDEKAKVLEEDLKNPEIHEYLFNLIAIKQNVEENDTSNKVGPDHLVGNMDEGSIDNDNLSKSLLVNDVEIGMDSTVGLEEPENTEVLTDFADLVEKETTITKANDNKIMNEGLDSKINLHEIKNTDTEEDLDLINNMNPDNIINTEGINKDNIQNPPQNKAENPEVELVKEHKSNSSIKDSDMELDTQPILITRNDFITVKDNLVDLEKTEIIDKEDLIQQIVERVKVDYQNPKNEIKIKLKPEILGEMTMNIEVSKGEIIAKIMVESHRTKEIIEGNIIQLKEEIKDVGLEIKTFEVFVGNDGDFDKHSFNQFNFNQNNRRIRIRNSNSKASLSYDEKLSETNTGMEVNNRTGLDLLA